MTRRSPSAPDAGPAPLDRLLADIRACRVCADNPAGKPLPHTPRPVVRLSATATIAICGQAPGTRVHASGIPFDDASGARLRDWMGVSLDEFYDERRVAFLPMGFCFPGQDRHGGDLPPRRECARLWRTPLLSHLPNVKLMLLIGGYAQRWHLQQVTGKPWPLNLSETVSDWRSITEAFGKPVLLPLPHPSWRNTGWIKKNPWFEAGLVPHLRKLVANYM
jgi:uracil-DNA glycosylase